LKDTKKKIIEYSFKIQKPFLIRKIDHWKKNS